MSKAVKETNEKPSRNRLLTINLDAQLYDYINEKPMTEPMYEIQGSQQVLVGEKKVTMRLAVQRVFFNLLRDEENLTGDQKMDIGNIGLRLSRGGDIEFTVDELKEIRKRCRTGMFPQYLVQIDPILEEALK